MRLPAHHRILACLAVAGVVIFPRFSPAATLGAGGDTTVWESVAGVEFAALLAGWAAGSSKEGDRAVGTASLGVALLAPGTGPGTGTLRVGFLVLGAYNFKLHRDEATRLEREQANFWGVNAVALAAWVATRGEVWSGSRLVNDGRDWAVAPWAAPQALGVAIQFRY